MKNLPNFRYEKDLWKQDYFVIGVDEVGRGSLAGPLFVAAFCLPPAISEKERKFLLNLGIDDSKRLKPNQRKQILSVLKKAGYFYSIASSSVSFINKYGIVRATQSAMRKSIENIRLRLSSRKLFVLADAFHIKYLKGVGLKNQKAIIRGDRTCLSIAAASVIAKVERDKFMKSLSRQIPHYFWSKNKGYGTKDHIRALLANGKSNFHRDLFIRKIFL